MSSETVAVVGGGITSAQVALKLLEEGHDVHLISRHEIREKMFDSDSGWLGPKHMTGFARVQDFDRRRQIINKARHRGSMPPEVKSALCRAIAQSQIRWHEDSVEKIEAVDERLRIRLKDAAALKVDRILLATGFAKKRPGGDFVDSLISSASLPCAECGYPVIDKGLRWHANVFVAGPLAELELGPVSRNIAGARRAADRLVDVVRKKKACTQRAS